MFANKWNVIQMQVAAIMLNAVSVINRAPMGKAIDDTLDGRPVKYRSSPNRVSQKKRRRYARQQGTTVKAMRS